MAFRITRKHEVNIPGYENAASVTPNDSTDLTNGARALYIGNSGGGTALNVDMIDGTTVAFVFDASTRDFIFPIGVRRVRSTGTSVDDIVALW